MLNEYCRAVRVPKKAALALTPDQFMSLRVPIPGKLHASQVALPRVTAAFLQIESVELKTNKSLGFAPENAVRGVLQHLAQALLDDQAAHGYTDRTARIQWRKKRQLCQVRLLGISCESLKREEPNLIFHYHTFATQCSDVIDHVVEQYAAQVKRQMNLLGDGSKLPQAPLRRASSSRAACSIPIKRARTSARKCSQT